MTGMKAWCTLGVEPVTCDMFANFEQAEEGQRGRKKKWERKGQLSRMDLNPRAVLSGRGGAARSHSRMSEGAGAYGIQHASRDGASLPARPEAAGAHARHPAVLQVFSSTTSSKLLH